MIHSEYVSFEIKNKMTLRKIHRRCTGWIRCGLYCLHCTVPPGNDRCLWCTFTHNHVPGVLKSDATSQQSKKSTQCSPSSCRERWRSICPKFRFGKGTSKGSQEFLLPLYPLHIQHALIPLGWHCYVIVQTTAIQETKKIKLQVRICMEFRLGGMILLQRPSDEETEILYRFLVGLYLPHEEDVGMMSSYVLTKDLARA